MGFVISMKFFSKFRTLAVLAVALMAIGTRAEAQALGLVGFDFDQSRCGQQFPDLHHQHDQSDGWRHYLFL